MINSWTEKRLAMKTTTSWLFDELRAGELDISPEYALRFMKGFQDELCAHFLWEEHGPLAVLLNLEKTIRRRVRERIQEHRNMETRLAGLIAVVERHLDERELPPYLESALADLLTDLAQHEELEGELWQDVRRSGVLPEWRAGRDPRTTHTGAFASDSRGVSWPSPN